MGNNKYLDDKVANLLLTDKPWTREYIIHLVELVDNIKFKSIKQIQPGRYIIDVIYKGFEGKITRYNYEGISYTYSYIYYLLNIHTENNKIYDVWIDNMTVEENKRMLETEGKELAGVGSLQLIRMKPED